MAKGWSEITGENKMKSYYEWLENIPQRERAEHYIFTYLNLHVESRTKELSEYIVHKEKICSGKVFDKVLSKMVEERTLQKRAVNKAEVWYSTKEWLVQQESIKDDMGGRVDDIAKWFDLLEKMAQYGIPITKLLFELLHYIRDFQNLNHLMRNYANMKRSPLLDQIEKKHIPNFINRFDELVLRTEPKEFFPLSNVSHLANVAIMKRFLEMDIELNEKIQSSKGKISDTRYHELLADLEGRGKEKDKLGKTRSLDKKSRKFMKNLQKKRN